jgi:hypothetical protein
VEVVDLSWESGVGKNLQGGLHLALDLFPKDI